jgi:hypothetical protein
MSKKEKDLEQEVKDEIQEEKVDKDSQEAWELLSDEEREAILSKDTPDESDTPSKDEPEISPDEEKPKEDEKDFEFLEDGRVRVGKQEFASKEEAMKSFVNLRGLKGRHDKEVEEARKQLMSKEVLPSEEENELPELPEFDETTPYDKEKLTTYIAAVAERIASEKTGNTMTAMMQRAKDERELHDFIEANPDLTTDDLKGIAKHGDEHGISSMKKAYRDMRYDENIKKAKLEGRAEILAELNQKPLKKSLSDAKGAGDSDTPKDVKDFTPEQWAKLPQSERDKYLEAA